MSRSESHEGSKKKSLMIAGGIVLLIVIVVIVAVLLFDINSYKSKIETAASEATDLDVRIKGRMGLSFFPFGISAKDIYVANKGSEIVSLESLKLRTAPSRRTIIELLLKASSILSESDMTR